MKRDAGHGRLETLCVSGCGVSDEGVRYLSQTCKAHLRHLNIAGTSITRLGALWVATYCTRLLSLNLQGTKVADDALQVTLLPPIHSQAPPGPLALALADDG